MKKSLSILLTAALSALSLFVFSFTSCEIGMGESVDLEAPEIEILEPKKLSNVHLEFEMSGTCKDNIKVTEVLITNFDTGKVYGPANINNSKGTWKFLMQLPKEEEGELTLLVTASDEAGNESTKSKKAITLLVDDTPPESQNWYIERSNGITTKLYSKSYLQNINTELSVNKDFSQNESFKVHGKVADGMSIKQTTITLKEDENPAVLYSEVVEGTYTPTIEVTHEKLIQNNPSLNTGKHYLRVYYECVDEHDNVISGASDYFIWDPESDVPKISQKNVENGALHVIVQNSIPVDYFDDDNVSEVLIALKNSSELFEQNGDEITEEDLKTNEAKRSKVFRVAYTVNTETYKAEFLEHKNSLEGVRDDTFIIPSTAVAVAAQMKLVLAVKETKTDGTDIWNAKIIPVYITDGEKPNLYITAPLENSMPVIKTGTGSKFDVKGYVLDKRDGEGILKIVYIPTTGNYDTTSKREEKADEILNTRVTGGFGSSTDIGEGITLLWQTVVTDNTFTDPTNKGWKRRNFSFEYDLLSSFGNDGNANKFFKLKYIDVNENTVSQSLNVDGDKTPPVITIASPENDMTVVNPNPENASFTLSFKGTKTTGLGMKDTSYKISIKGQETNYTYTVNNSDVNRKLTKNGQNYEVTLNKNELKAIEAKVKQPTFEFYVEDKLGNYATDRRTIVLSDLPKAESITSDENNGTYTAGKTLRFKVNFDKEVKVEENASTHKKPRLVLYYSEADRTAGTPMYYADYESGSTTSTLTFKYDVPANARATKLCCPDTGYMDLQGAQIETAGIGEGAAVCGTVAGNNLEGKELQIDSVLPYFTSIKISAGGTSVNSKKYVKAEDEITAVLTATKNVLISGSPKLVLKSGSSALSFDFQGLNNNKVTFVHKVTSDSPDGTVVLNGTSYFTTGTNGDAKEITDEIGNLLKTSPSLNALSLETGSDTVVIDRSAPTKPALKLKSATNTYGIALAAGNYTEAQTLMFSGLETDTKLYYSWNGGASWLTATDSERTSGVSVPRGKESQITAKQVDLAGNDSGKTTDVTVYVASNFPAVTGLTITNANGYYRQYDDEGNQQNITIKLSFEENVKLTTANAYLTFTDKDGNNERSAYFATSATGTKTLTATYAIRAGDSFEGVRISGLVKGSLQDAYGLTPGDGIIGSFLTEGNGLRDEIKVDTVIPTLSSSVPVNGGVSAHRGTIAVKKEDGKDEYGNAPDQFVITLTFSEPVYKEKGYITLQRIGADTSTNKDNWAIPAIIELEDFTKIYNQLGKTDRETLMKTEGGNGEGAEKLQDKTARPLGPYMKYTQGINSDGSPNQKTRYVLAPEYGLFDTTETGDVAKIRNVLASIGYHKHKVDVNSTQVTGEGTNTITITFNERIEDGQHWVLLIDNTAFRDNAKNYYAGLSYTDASYTFWSKHVAEPVVRVDRYSHNIGAEEPRMYVAGNANIVNSGTGWQLVTTLRGSRNVTKWTDNGKSYNDADANSGTKLAPTGYAKVRIDCETPGAVITFGVDTGATGNGATSGANNPPSTTTYDANGKISDIPNVAKASITSPSDTNAYTLGQWIVVGDGLYTSARKDYVSAKATAPVAASTMTTSSTGYEGVFKTVVNYKGYSDQIQIQGGTFNGGMPSIPGFPLRDAVQGEGSQRYNQNTYRPATETSDKDHYWVTYDIISEYSILSVHNTSGWSQKYSYGKYGQISTLSNISHY